MIFRLEIMVLPQVTGAVANIFNRHLQINSQKHQIKKDLEENKWFANSKIYPKNSNDFLLHFATLVACCQRPEAGVFKQISMLNMYKYVGPPNEFSEVTVQI